MTITERIAELKEHEVFGKWADWAIEARATCDIEGHAAIIDSACVRCRASVTVEKQVTRVREIDAEKANPCMANDPTQPCTVCHSYCDGDCGY